MYGMSNEEDPADESTRASGGAAPIATAAIAGGTGNRMPTQALMPSTPKGIARITAQMARVSKSMVLTGADDDGHRQADRSGQDPQREALGVEKPLKRPTVAKRREGTLRVAAEHVRRRDVGEHPRLEHDRKRERAVDGEEPVA